MTAATEIFEDVPAVEVLAGPEGSGALSTYLTPDSDGFPMVSDVLTPAADVRFPGVSASAAPNCFSNEPSDGLFGTVKKRYQ